MSTKQCTVSVIVPVYNVAQYLEQCLDSVVNQTMKELEIILVNDGSTDGSDEICEQYAKQDERVILLHQKNQGLAAARQAGLDVAHGEYIGFVDSDDWLELSMYEEMYDAARNNNADIVFCNVYRNENKKEQIYFAPGLYTRSQMEETIFPRLLAGFDENGGENTIRWCNWLRLYKKDVIDKHGICFDKRFRRSQDLPFTFECTIHANSYYYLGESYLYHNRMNYESLSKGYTKNMWGLIKPLILYLQDVVDTYSEYDFQKQMHRRAALFVFECCENENKPNNKRSINERLRTIREIMRDEDAIKWIKELDLSGMRRINQLYAFCFRYKLALLFYLLSEKRYANRKRDYKNKTSQEKQWLEGKINVF